MKTADDTTIHAPLLDFIDHDECNQKSGTTPVAPFAIFPTTRWDLVRILQREDDTKKVTAAYNALCAQYWHPVYSVLTKHFSHHEAQDVAQEFFLKRAIRINLFLVASEEKGTLRNLISMSLKWHLDSYLRLHHYSKRRGGLSLHVPLDLIDTASDIASDTASGNHFHELDIAWARELHTLIMARLRQEYLDGGKLSIFEVLSCRLDDPAPQGYLADIEILQISSEAARIAVFRMRKRYEALKQDLIAGLTEQIQ